MKTRRASLKPPRAGPTRAHGWTLSNYPTRRLYALINVSTQLGTAHMGMDIDLTSMPGITSEHDLDDILAPGRRIGGPGSIRGGVAGATAPKATPPASSDRSR